LPRPLLFAGYHIQQHYQWQHSSSRSLDGDLFPPHVSLDSSKAACTSTAVHWAFSRFALQSTSRRRGPPIAIH
jgi:hypothetical protein